MDTIPDQPVQTIPNQQIPIQSGATFTPSPIQELPQKQRSLRKLFNVSSWVVLFALLPLTILIFLSQDSIPGDLFYPVKRSLENVVLAAASVNPATRAAFRTDLTETRFQEAQNLVVSKSNASGLTTFIDEVQSTKQEVVSLKNDTEREKAEEKLAVKIQEYQNGLSTLEAKTEQTIIAYQFQTSPTPVLVPTSTPIPTVNPLPSSKPQSTPTLTPVPTLTLAPTIAPIVSSQPVNAQIAEQKRIAETIRDTKEKLDKIKKDLEENRSEDRQKKNKKDEDETHSKQDSNRKTEASDRQK
jgi:hypothetical protein